MFNHARNVVINGGSFSIKNGIPEEKALDILLQKCALGAFLDSDERFDPPRVAEHTRNKIIQEIINWLIEDSSSPSMLWLHGPAGAGKSAIAQTIAERAQELHLHGASFFFCRTASSQRSNGNTVIPTLVYQLAQNDPKFRELVDEAIREDPALFSRSRDRQMQRLFVEPHRTLGLLQKSKRHRMKEFARRLSLDAKVSSLVPQARLILIDGLDECQFTDVQKDLLRIIAKAMPRLDATFRFLITSRPESHIVSTFDQDPAFRSVVCRRINLDDDPEASKDIRRFAMQKFADIRSNHPLRCDLSASWPSEEAITALVMKSSSQFIFLSTAMQYIAYPLGHPDRRLDVILGLASTEDNPLCELDKLYSFLLSQIKHEDWPVVSQTFGLMYLSSQDRRISYRLSTSVVDVELILGLRRGQLTILFDPLMSLIHVPIDRSSQLRAYHASIFDFLLDKGRSKGYHVDLTASYEAVALHWIKIFRGTERQGSNEHVMSPVECCSVFLATCMYARWSEELRTYLEEFPFLYDVVLERPAIWKLVQVVHRFLQLPLRKEFGEDGPRLHAYHARKIRDELAKRLRIRSVDCEMLFTNQIEQSRHEVYALLSEKLAALDLQQNGVFSTWLVDNTTPLREVFEEWNKIHEEIAVHTLISISRYSKHRIQPRTLVEAGRYLQRRLQTENELTSLLRQSIQTHMADNMDHFTQPELEEIWLVWIPS